MKKMIVLIAAALLSAGARQLGRCAPGGWEPSEAGRSSGRESGRERRARSLYEEGLKAAGEEDYEGALRLFEESGRIERRNPETLNMTAYCLRKLGRIEDAFEFYQKALRLKPDFPQAREYLAEAHLDMAAKQIELLKSYGGEGKKELDKLGEALKRLSRELEAE